MVEGEVVVFNAEPLDMHLVNVQQSKFQIHWMVSVVNLSLVTVHLDAHTIDVRFVEKYCTN